MSARNSSPDRACPCGSGDVFEACCGPLHAGVKRAATAEQLMRSRYSAYAVGNADYVLRTWHPSTCPRQLDLDDSIRWTRLEMVATIRGGLFDTSGIVEFRAYYRQSGQREVLHEVSEFVRVDRMWMYLSGRHT